MSSERRAPPPAIPTLEWSGERYVPQLEGNIKVEHLHRYLLAREWCRGRRVLDIACGEGYGSDLLASVASFVVGVDNAPNAVSHARSRYGRAHLAFAVGQCSAMPLRDATVDVVVSFETIEHHDRHDEMLREVKRVLRPGGLLVISSPDRHEYSDVPAYTNAFHVKELYRDEFERLLGRHFSHVAIAGQRVRAGSVIWPLAPDAVVQFRGFEAGAEGTVGRPLGPALYIIATASDAPAPPMPAGLLDGGAFLWPAEGDMQALVEGRAQTERENARLRHELAAARQAGAAHEARANALASSGAALERRCDELTQAAQAAERERRRFEEHLATVERSYSWRLMAPLRALRRRLGW